MSDKLSDLCNKTNLWEGYQPKDLGWIDDIKPLDEFFFWLKNCVTDQNCITSEELEAYKTLSEFGNFEDEEENSVNKNYTAESIKVYHPYNRNTEVLETFYCQNQKRLVNHEDFFNVVKTQEKTVDHCKVASKVDQMLDNEVRKVNSLIAGDYRRSALALASKCSQLNANVKNVSENVNSSELVCLTPMNTFCDLMECLNLYVTNVIEAFQEEFTKNHSSLEGSSYGNSFSASRNLDQNFKRIFDDCVHMKAYCVGLEAKIEGIAKMSSALDFSDLTAFISSSDKADSATSDELHMVCYNQVRAAFLRHEENFNKYGHIKRRRNRILSKLETIKRIVRPLKLCCDSVVVLIKHEYKWIRIARAILSDFLGSLEEIHYQIEQSFKQLRNIQAVQELSTATHTSPDITSTFLKLFESCCDVSAASHNDTALSARSTVLSDCRDKKVLANGVTRMYAGRLDSVLRNTKTFSEDVISLLSHARAVYSYIFNGPSATMPLELDLVSSIIRISRELKAKKEKLEKLECQRFEIEIHRRNSELCDLVETFWLLYLKNPLQLRQTIEALEKRSQLDFTL